MSRPRLFYILDSLEENEVGDHVVTLLGRLPRSRFEPRVVSLGPKGTLGDRLRESKVPVHELELSGAMGALMAVPRLRKLLGRLNAQILQTFQPWSGTVAQLAAPRDAQVFRWVEGFPPAPASMEERLQAWLERRASMRRKRHFITSDARAVERVGQEYRVDNVEVVPQCLDLGQLRSRVEGTGLREARLRLGLEEGQRTLAAVSDFRDRARMSQLLEGFATARREEPGLRLFLAGQGPEEGAVRGLAEDLRLEDSVIFVGTNQDRPTMLRVADVVVDAGSWPGWARCAVEAMAMEVPVLRWVDDEDDPEARQYSAHTTGPADRFARDVLDVLEDAPLRARMVQRAAEEARAFDVALVADRWTEIYGQ
ncbi:MAG TPA: glycosyltransferase [Longimicrobiales bacterium]|nr:glycosyltransferase [Longimicrobiales bacterium]